MDVSFPTSLYLVDFLDEVSNQLAFCLSVLESFDCTKREQIIYESLEPFYSHNIF